MLAIVIFFQIVHLLYHQITTNIDFHPFNNIRNYTGKQRILESLVNGILMCIPPTAFVLGISWAMWFAVLVYGILMIGEYWSWWKHYFFSPDPEWLKTYNHIFRETIIVLPKIGSNPVPNLEHTILHSLTFICFLLTLIFNIKYL